MQEEPAAKTVPAPPLARSYCMTHANADSAGDPRGPCQSMRFDLGAGTEQSPRDKACNHMLSPRLQSECAQRRLVLNDVTHTHVVTS